MDTQINVGVVGCGYWGPNLIRNFQFLPNCKVGKVADLNQERLGHIKQLYPDIEVTTEFDHILQDDSIDAIAIATPVWTHHELAKKSLKARKHTFIEKPMASSTDQCRELVGLAKNRNLTLMVGHTYIYSAAVRRIKEIVDSGDIGKLLYINTQRLNLGLFQKDINVTWDLAPHDLSIILHIMDSAPVSVNCQGRRSKKAGIEDVTNMSLSFKNGGFAIVQSSWLDPNKVRRMTFVGSNRMIFFDDNETLEKIRIYDKRVEAPPHYDSFVEFQYSYHHGDQYVPHLKQAEPLKTMCEVFLESIVSGEKPLSSGFEGLQVVQLLEAASESLKLGGAKVKIPDLITTMMGEAQESDAGVYESNAVRKKPRGEKEQTQVTHPSLRAVR